MGTMVTRVYEWHGGCYCGDTMENLINTFTHRVAYNLNEMRQERKRSVGEWWQGYRIGKLMAAKRALRDLLAAAPQYREQAAKYFRYCLK